MLSSFVSPRESVGLAPTVLNCGDRMSVSTLLVGKHCPANWALIGYTKFANLMFSPWPARLWANKARQLEETIEQGPSGVSWPHIHSFSNMSSSLSGPPGSVSSMNPVGVGG